MRRKPKLDLTFLKQMWLVDAAATFGVNALSILSRFLMALLCCRRNLLNVLDFLKKPNACTLVSGTRDRVNLHDKFKKAVEAKFPGKIDQLMLEAEEKAALQKKPSFWDSVTDSKAGAFKFSF